VNGHTQYIVRNYQYKYRTETYLVISYHNNDKLCNTSMKKSKKKSHHDPYSIVKKIA